MKKTLAVMIITLLATPIFAGLRHRTYHHHTLVVAKPIVTNQGYVDINCNRDRALVYVNGRLAGKADEFDGFPSKLHLKQGAYRIKIESNGKVKTFDLFVTAGHEINLDVEF